MLILSAYRKTEEEIKTIASFNMTDNVQEVTSSYNIMTSPAAVRDDLPGLHSTIQIAYTLSAIYSAFFCVLFLVFYIRGHNTRSSYSKQLNRKKGTETRSSDSKWKDFLNSYSPGSCTGGKTLFGFQIFILIFIYYANIVGGERVYGKFIFSYAVEGDQKFSTNQAATLNSIFWIGFTAGRGLSSIAAYWCSPVLLIAIELTVNVICGIVLTIWGLSIPGVLWVFTCILGLFLSPVFPSGLAWSNLYVEMKGLAVTVVYIGASVGAIIYQWVGGYLFEYHGPATLMYVMLGYALTLTATFILMVIVVRPHGKRYAHK